MTAHAAEVETLRAFIASPGRRDRLVGVLSTKKRRTELDRALSHEDDLWDSRYVVRLSADNQNARAVEALLRERGAPSTCRVLGGSRDGEELDLDAALTALVGTLDGCLLICRPGHLAYHESEDPGRRVVLARS
jgi:hypothetical protein